MNFSALFHHSSVWLFRIAIVGGMIGVAYVYMNGDRGMPGERLARSAAAPVEAGFTPCQPIGHTAAGELIYSMDCEQLPAPDKAARSAR